MNVRKIFTLVSVALALCVAVPAHAQTSPKVKSIDPPKSVLYVGNSFFYFNDSMHRFVGGLQAAAEPQSRGQYRATSVMAVYGKSLAGLKYYGGLDEKTAVFLQEVAWESVKEYYGR